MRSRNQKAGFIWDMILVNKTTPVVNFLDLEFQGYRASILPLMVQAVGKKVLQMNE